MIGTDFCFFCFTEVPFAKLDAVLLLIKTCLKGELVDKLNAKDNQVFLDYIAGGQNAQIAQEREANATSGGALNAAARNAVGLDESPSAIGGVQESASAVRELALQLQECRNIFAELPLTSVIQADTAAAKELVVQLRECKVVYVDFASTKLEMEAKLHEQAIEFARAKAEMEAQLHAQTLEHNRAKAEMEAQFNAQTLEHNKAMAELECVKVDNKKRSLDIDTHAKEVAVQQEATLLKIRLEHEAGLVKVRADEADKNLERDAKRAKLNSSSNAKRNDNVPAVVMVGLRRSTRKRNTRN